MSEGWANGFMAALHDDLVFNAMGTSPVAGRYQGKQVYRTQVLDRLHTRLASWPMPIVDTMIVDGNMASVQFHSEGGKGHNGASLEAICNAFKEILDAVSPIECRTTFARPDMIRPKVIPL